MFQRLILPSILLACMIVPAAAADAVGEWLVADGTARIRIEPCKGALWGVIAWAKSPGKDENNPDPAKRNRSVIGLPILLNMKKATPNRWDGEVYNAKDGDTYTANITLVSDDVLRIEGCVLGGLFCDGENWTRYTSGRGSSTTTPRQKDTCP